MSDYSGHISEFITDDEDLVIPPIKSYILKRPFGMMPISSPIENEIQKLMNEAYAERLDREIYNAITYPTLCRHHFHVSTAHNQLDDTNLWWLCAKCGAAFVVRRDVYYKEGFIGISLPSSEASSRQSSEWIRPTWRSGIG